MSSLFLYGIVVFFALGIIMLSFTMKPTNVSAAPEKEGGDDEKTKFFAGHPDLKERIEPFEAETCRFIERFDAYRYLNSDDAARGYWDMKFRDACTYARDFRDAYYDIVKICNCGQEKLSDMYDLEDKFLREYKKVAAIARLDDVASKEVKGPIGVLEDVALQMKAFLEELTKEVSLEKPEQEELVVEEKPYARLVKIMKAHEDDEIVTALGDEILDLYAIWIYVIKTGLMDEFFETRKMLDDLTDRLADFTDGQCNKEIVAEQLEKAKKNMSLLREIAEVRMRNDSETVEDELNLDSWHTVLTNVLNQEQLKM